VDSDAHRTPLLIALLPALVAVDAHWHEGIRAAGARVLGLFEAADGPTFAALRRAVEAEAEGAADADAGGGGGGGGDAAAAAAAGELQQLSLEAPPPRSPPAAEGGRRAGFVLPVSDVGLAGAGGAAGRRGRPITLMAAPGDE